MVTPTVRTSRTSLFKFAERLMPVDQTSSLVTTASAFRAFCNVLVSPNALMAPMKNYAVSRYYFDFHFLPRWLCK